VSEPLISVLLLVSHDIWLEWIPVAGDFVNSTLLKLHSLTSIDQLGGFASLTGYGRWIVLASLSFQGLLSQIFSPVDHGCKLAAYDLVREQNPREIIIFILTKLSFKQVIIKLLIQCDPMAELVTRRLQEALQSKAN
jgi:hypothetical protein